MDTATIKKEIETFIQHLPLEIEGLEHKHDEEIGADIFILKHNNPHQVIGKNGETLKAINYIVRKIIEEKHAKNDKVPNFTIDINNYYGKKLEELKTKAKIIANRAKSFKRNIELDSLSAYERLIIHSVLAKYPDIHTESSGFGKGRRLTVFYKES